MFNPILSWYWAFGWMTSVEYQILLNLIFFSSSFQNFHFSSSEKWNAGFWRVYFVTELSVRLEPKFSDNFIYFSENVKKN